jgi:hypothetical protein
MVSIAAFTLTMLVGATTVWAARKMGGGVNLAFVLWVLFPTTFFFSSIVLEYIDNDSLARSLRASLFNTGLAAAIAVLLYGIAYVLS